MRTTKLLFFTTLAFIGSLFVSCSDNDNKDNEITIKLTAILKYEKDGVELIDDGARICIFKAFGDTESWVFDQKTYKYILPSGAAYIPDYMLVMRAEGSIEETITLEKDASYIYVYVPKVDPAKYEVHNLETNRGNINISKVFK